MIQRSALRPYFKMPRSALMPWSLPALCAAYRLPRNLPGSPKPIGIGELGGAWDLANNAFFADAGMPVPMITNVGALLPPDPGGADGEVALDIEVASYVYWYCTGQLPRITMLWGSDIAAITQQAADEGVGVLSWSWGAPENSWGDSAAMQMEMTAMNVTQAGVTICAASGDSDAGDGEPGLHVDLPAACPHVIACGGTRKTPIAESVWNDGPSEGTGGGYAKFFPMPAWQKAGKAPRRQAGRMVSDVAALADPVTGYEIYIAGQKTVIGGTSAVAPFYAGLFAAMGGNFGFVSDKLWAAPADCFTPVTMGNDDPWPGNVCCGRGVADVVNLIGAL